MFFWEAIRFLLGKIMFFTSAFSSGSYLKPLSEEDEKKFLLLAKQGDEKAKEKLIRHNMRLVAHIVKKYNGCAEAEDMISVGSIGLIKAINSYEIDKGSRLATYMARCIENEILMLIRANKKHKNVISLQDSLGADKDGNELTLNDLLCEREDSVFQKVEKTAIAEKLLELLKRNLTEREYRIICLRYGLNGYAPLPQREVALLLKISRSYVSRIEKKGIEKLRNCKELKEFN